MLVPFLFLLGPTVAYAASPWEVACHYGHCSHTKQEASGRNVAHGQLNLLGSLSAISDLSPIAGWTILECHPGKMSQDIRAICTGTDEQCEHLYQNGAVGTIVRLPDDCGPMPFARIASECTHHDQSLPEDLDTELSRRDVKPLAKGLTLDTDFAAVDPAVHGNVSFLFQGVSASDLSRPSFIHPTHSSLLTRDFLDGILNGTSFNFTNSSTVSDLSVDKTVNLLDQAINCPDLPEAAVKVDIVAKANVSFSYGVVFVGTVTPPNVTDFRLTSTLDTVIAGNLGATSSISQTFETDKIVILEVPVPGLSYPGIVTVGPSFQVSIQGKATIDTVLDLNVDLAYNVSGANFNFPPRNSTNSTLTASDGSFNPSDTNLDLAAAPGFASHGSLEAHFIPAIVFGIEALGGVATANVFLNLDTAAILNLSLNKTTPPTTGNSSAPQFAGCVGVQTALSVNVGTDATFFDIFENTTSITLFENQWDLFEKCWETGPKPQSKFVLPEHPLGPRLDHAHVPIRSSWFGTKQRSPRELIARQNVSTSEPHCLPPPIESAVPIVQQLFNAASIKGGKKGGTTDPSQ